MKRVKEIYKGLIVQKNHMIVGNITFDSTKVSPEHYENFIKLGFEELFEDVPETIEIKDLSELPQLLLETDEPIKEEITKPTKGRKKKSE